MGADVAFPALSLPGARLLCIGAHPDDLEIGAFGTIHRLLAENPTLDVTWVVLSGTSERREEATASYEALVRGARGTGSGPGDEVRFGDLPDGRFPTELGRLKEELEALKPLNPALVIAPFIGDRHQDHRATAEAVWQTFRDHTVLSYEIAKYEGDLAQPNLHTRLTQAEADAKVAHLLAHFPSQHDRQWYDEALFRGLMRVRGVECNNRWAEGLHAAKLTW